MSKYGLFLSNPNQVVPLIPNNNKHFELEELQELVGGLIEFYPLKFQDRLIIVNEEGLVRNLEPNEPFKKLSGIELVGNVLLIPPSLLPED